MLKIIISNHTVSSVSIELTSPVTFSTMKLYLFDDAGVPTEIDRYDVSTHESDRSALSLNSQTGIITIDVNMLPFDSIYNKNYIIQFLNDQAIEVETTQSFKVLPEGVSHLYGVSNKLKHDFEVMASFSGLTIRVFNPSPIANRCSNCWDYDLEQPISSTCGSCGGNATRFIVDDVLCRKIKTSTKQSYSDKGSVETGQVVLQTYDRVDLRKGTLFIDQSVKAFYEVVDRTIATVGGIRTSTMIIGRSIKDNDSRIQEILHLIN